MWLPELIAAETVTQNYIIICDLTSFHLYTDPLSHLKSNIINKMLCCKGRNFVAKEQACFPGGSLVKNLPAYAGDMGSIPGLGRSHMHRSN